MFKNWFNFYPVGHGLFYAGSLRNFEYHFVYDCGTKTNKKGIDHFSNHLYKLCDNGILQFVAISHFHEDHISGLANLFKLFHIKEVIAPYISGNPILKLAVFAAMMVVDESKEYNIENILMILNRIIENDNEWKSDDNGVMYQKRKCHDYWNFVFASKPITNKEETDFENEMDTVFAAHPECKRSVIELIRDGHIDEIRTAYLNVFKGKGLNETSMIMLHFPTAFMDISHSVFTNNPGHLEYQIKYVFPVSLLTGDIKLDNHIASFVDGIVSDNVGIIQVPHHGSYLNWNALDTNLKRTCSVYLMPKGKKQKVANLRKTLKALSNKDYKIVDEYNGYNYWITTKSSYYYENETEEETIDQIYNSVLGF